MDLLKMTLSKIQREITIIYKNYKEVMVFKIFKLLKNSAILICKINIIITLI
jgi:hypothetical protein